MKQVVCFVEVATIGSIHKLKRTTQLDHRLHLVRLSNLTSVIEQAQIEQPGGRKLHLEGYNQESSFTKATPPEEDQN